MSKGTEADNRNHLAELPSRRTPSGQVRSEWPLRLSPTRLILLMTILIFLGEGAVMLLLRILPPLPWPVVALIDASSLLVILSPVYFFLFLPLKDYHSRHQQADREIAYLSQQTIRAVEEEKKRLSHDLHDECGQILTALQFGIETLKLSLPAGERSAAQQCDRLAALTSQLCGQLRSLTARLRPTMLESRGIAETLRQHLQQFSRQWPELKVDLQIVGCTSRLSPDAEITFYRLCQEGLNNIVKHANARQVKVRLRCGEEIELTIEDDGVGFSPEQTRGTPRGLGILGMRERVAAHCGRLEIHTAVGRGTVIHAVLPALAEERA